MTDTNELKRHRDSLRVVTRDVLPSECRWLVQPILAGQTVFLYSGHDYGCIGTGIAVSLEFGETPFFELPADAVAAVNAMPELLALREENERLKAALEECADELEQEFRNRHQPDLHPASKSRFDRDMVTVRDARAALSGGKP